jgi:hypothetical protein
LSLPRLGREILLTSRPVDGVADAVPDGVPVLVTNLGLEDVRSLSRRLAGRSRLVGFWSSLGYWMLIDVAPSALPATWRDQRARPLGLPALAR